METLREKDVKWLTAEEQRAWRNIIEGVNVLLEGLNQDLEADAELNLHEYETLVRLSEAPKHTLRMSELARELAHSRSRITHTVRRLEKRGYVTRVSCLRDGRGINCVLNDAGLEKLAASAPGHVASVRSRLLCVIKESELKALGLAFEKVIRANSRPNN